MTNTKIKFLSRSFFALACLILLGASYSNAEVQGQGAQFFNIAHGTNLKASVDLAISSGANALEMDLQFDEKKGGIPTEFHHGIPCDCSCAPVVLIGEKDKGTASLCRDIWFPCIKSTAVKEMFQYITQKYSDKVSFIYIDGKVSKFKNKALLKNAGKNIFNTIKDELFNKGYKGQIVFGIPYKADVDYLIAINEELKKPENSALLNRVFFTIDWEQKDAGGTLKFMADSGLGKNMVYSIGESICFSTTFYDHISSVYNEYLSKKTIGLNIIWTLDRSASIEKYIKLGANAVMSNSPEKVSAIAQRLGYVVSPANRISN